MVLFRGTVLRFISLLNPEDHQSDLSLQSAPGTALRSRSYLVNPNPCIKPQSYPMCTLFPQEYTFYWGRDC